MAQQPMYQQIADTIRRQIEGGELARGARLPTELELRSAYNASRNTIRDAIKRLAALGLVETRPGQGTFVTVNVDPFVTTMSADPRSAAGGGEGPSYLSAVSEAHRKPETTTPRVEVQIPPPEIQHRLRLPDDAQAVLRHQRRLIDDIPWSLQTSYYPMDFITKGATDLLIAQDMQPGTITYLNKVLGVRQIGYRDWVTVRQPNENEQRFFNIAHDTAVFEIFRTAFDQNKSPMRVTVTVCPADRNQLIYDIGDDLPDPKYGEETVREETHRKPDESD
ncbi:MAG: GntR family transcriptional regulator [Nocardiopsaceae bacterium]|nr:GntR family transcriptional regulator [Nocardiopsaceae bacterium]